MSYWKVADKKTVMIDCDQTLIMWEDDAADLSNSVIQVANGNLVVKFHRRHIELVKQFFAIGWNVIVWSQGGSDHAEHVVKACKLENHIHGIMPKPDVVLDDKPLEAQGIRRSYHEDDL